ncbi:MAG: hypothetical protein ACRELU_01095 [Gemmatimonadota bacterium]
MGLFLLQACGEELPSSFTDAEDPLVLQDSEKKLDHLTVCAPTGTNFPSPLTSTNAYFPIVVDHQWTLEGEEDGVPVKLLLTILDETREIDGIRTRVFEEREWEDDELIEVSWNYVAETADGTVCYFGEDVDDIEDDEVVDHAGRWCAEDTPDVNKAGIFMPADPKPGMTFLQEDAPGIALDGAKIVGSGPVSVPFDTFSETIRFREFSLIEGKGDYKAFGNDFGLLVDGPLELTDFTENAVDPGDPISQQVCGSP